MKEEITLFWRRLIAMATYFLCIGYGGCLRCWRRWPVAKNHITYYTNRHGASNGMSSLCMDCWRDLTPEARLPFYRTLYRKWAGEWPPNRSLPAFEEIERAVEAEGAAIETVTERKLDAYFIAGDRQAEIDYPARCLAVCPMQDSIAKHWWSRGYAYKIRILRAIEAEAKLEAAEQKAKAYRQDSITQVDRIEGIEGAAQALIDRVNNAGLGHVWGKEVMALQRALGVNDHKIEMEAEHANS